MQRYCGLQVGRNGVYGIVLRADGHPLARAKFRFQELHRLPDAYTNTLEQLGDLEGVPVVVGLDKVHRSYWRPTERAGPQLVCPTLSVSLLGAIPHGPGLYLHLGQEIKLAVIDSTHTYREFRFLEGGGSWWLGELQKLSAHSPRLRAHLKTWPEGEVPLAALPQLLEIGQFPTPCAVLKPRLEKVARSLGNTVVTAAARLPGLRRYALGGFLSESGLGRLIHDHLAEHFETLKPTPGRFPPEVGSALIGLAWHKENEERSHLKKDPLALAPVSQDWAPPPVLVRRLYRMRKPFEEYSA